MTTSFRFLTQFTQSPNGYLFDGEEGATPGGATPTPSAPAAAPTSAASAQSAPATPSAQTPAPATGAPEGWVPSYRVRETREAAQREYQTQMSELEGRYKAELDRVQAQIRSLVGVNPPANPEVDAVRSQFASLYPGLAKMEDRAAQLEQLLERAGDLESQTTHYWTTYGRQTMDRLFDHAATTIGAPLTDEGKRALHSAFTGFVQSSPELTARYAQDPTIVEDFWNVFSSSFIDPARRTATASTVGRVAGAIPQDAPSGSVRTAAAAPPKPADLDERTNMAWALYNQKANKTI